MNRSYWAGHLLQFDSQPSEKYSSAAGTRLLVVFIVMEFLLGPRLAVAEWFGIPIPDLITRVPALLLLALMLTRSIAGIGFNQIGLHAWRYWTATERWYFIETLGLVNVVFMILLLPKLKVIASQPELWSTMMSVLFIQILWGFYQELIYRGMLQTELVRRLGVTAGILISNTVFTFGPLHFYHLHGIGENPSQAWIFAAIFAIGLFFGILFHRSGNLWIAGVFHGIGDWYISGVQQVVSTG